MNSYAMHEHYQKAMDAIADRFYKAMGLTTLVCFSFAWGILSHDPTSMRDALGNGFLVLAGMFLVMAIMRPAAVRKVKLVDARYDEDHRATFGEAPKLALTGLFPGA
ncbi:hypothetical protein [Novosphingobium album (ex Liu et al. 2023)]|uniref:Uncharacterized protein n=1 Tax=Novosphingobium album (ex Liu et al. 2023) TaxID=3031130 RepID=A0ABT5WR77_9SPHN|nr:hypothetical protein [Novosphingobium album (ex Liu et al. 2023)]MDE8652553.1 hypothetical protein [Novosphingobium album (ex Liu et al. 2023)]